MLIESARGTPRTLGRTRFSLRSAMVAVALLSSLLGLVAAKYVDSKKRLASMKHLLSAGAGASFYYQHQMGPDERDQSPGSSELPVTWKSAAEPYYPRWIEEYLGLEALYGVYNVTFRFADPPHRLTDEKLTQLEAQLQAFPELAVLDISESSVSDASVPTLAKFTNLRFLIAANCRISANGFARIQTSLPKLTVLVGPGNWPLSVSKYYELHRDGHVP